MFELKSKQKVYWAWIWEIAIFFKEGIEYNVFIVLLACKFYLPSIFK